MWTSEIKDKVFSIVQYEGRRKLLSKYPTINFTSVNKKDTEPTFPNVYVKQLQGAGTGYTLEDAQPNGAIASYQIEVTDNESQNNTEYIADIIADIMTSMEFRMLGEPFPDNDVDAFRNVARYQRVIGANDRF